MFTRSWIRSLRCPAATILTFVGSIASAYACTCSEPSLPWIQSNADVIFRGTLLALPPATGPQGYGDTFDTGKIAVFRVSRVWKGNVGPTVEMPALLETSACWGFDPSHLTIGDDLLVFAFRMTGESGASILETTICSRTALAKGNSDLEGLGLGYAPTIPSETKPAKTYFASILFIVAVAAYMMLKRKAWVFSR